MAKQTIDAVLLFGAGVNKKNENMMRLMVAPGQFLDVAKPIYDMAIKGEISGLEYDDETAPLAVVDANGVATNLQFHRVMGVVRSRLGNLQQAKLFVEAADGLDLAKFEEAKTLSDKIVF